VRAYGETDEQAIWSWLMQRDRRHNPYPHTWEIPLGIACAVLLVLVLGAHTGRVLANLTAGAGITFPPATDLFTSTVDLVRGDATAGLTQVSASVATPGVLYVWMAVTELVVLVCALVVGVWVYGRWGRRVRGMATKAQAEQLLGLTRLRKVRRVVRPDLYPSKRAR